MINYIIFFIFFHSNTLVGNTMYLYGNTEINCCCNLVVTFTVCFCLIELNLMSRFFPLVAFNIWEFWVLN